MSKEALYARIEGCRQEIAYNQKEIQKLEAKIEEYEYIRAKVVRSLQEEAGELTSRLKETVTEYVTEIDAADNYIY